MNYPVYYEDKSTYEDVGKTTGVSDTNVVQRSKYNDRHRSYTEYTRSTIKYPMASPQACVGGTYNPEDPGMARKMRLSRDARLSHLTAVTGAVWKSDRL